MAARGEQTGALISRPARAARSVVAGLVSGLVALAGVALPADAGPVSSATAAATGETSSSIIGGTRTTRGQYPSVVAILVDGNLCTGTLITQHWVLTAAHCVDPIALNLPSQEAVTQSTKVYLHTLDVVGSPGVVRNAIRTIKDPQFDKQRLGSNDLGLIRLEQPVTDVEPSSINFVAAKAPVGTVTTLVGYGNTQVGAQGPSGVQYELANRRSESCVALGIGSDDNLLCFSQRDQKGTCQGDSGGPAFAVINGRKVVVAVTSFGDADCSQYSGDTRIDAEQAFLMMHIPELGGCFRDDDCPMGRACFAHNCIAQPYTPTGIGAECSSSEDCESSQCAGTGSGVNRCSMACVLNEESSCPEGFKCSPAGDSGGGACWPDAGGCCDASGNGAPGAIVLALAVLGLVTRRRNLRR